MMGAIIRIIFAAGFTLSVGQATGSGSAPSFDTFRTSPRMLKQAAALRIQSAQDREYRSVLQAASKKPVNFAGHLVLTSIGCGASCVLTAALDKQTGTVTWLPFTICCWDLAISEPLEFRPDSALLVVHGQRNEAGGTGPHYYRFTGGRFKEVR
jgi:hypothetical protein